MHEDNYITLVKEAMNRAYVPYSNYPVGALVLTDKGNTYSGCNVENASYPEGHCAETAAIASMVMGGEKNIRLIYVMSQNDQGGCPCGGCRQRIREFSDIDTQVILCSPSGVQPRLLHADLLQKTIGPEQL